MNDQNLLFTYTVWQAMAYPRCKCGARSSIYDSPRGLVALKNPKTATLKKGGFFAPIIFIVGM